MCDLLCDLVCDLVCDLLYDQLYDQLYDLLCDLLCDLQSPPTTHNSKTMIPMTYIIHLIERMWKLFYVLFHKS